MDQRGGLKRKFGFKASSNIYDIFSRGQEIGFLVMMLIITVEHSSSTVHAADSLAILGSAD